MSDAERGYTITRTFDATPEMIWAAWTVPEYYGAWFGTDATEMRDVHLDVRPGGEWRGTMILPGDAGRIEWRGVYREVVPPVRLVVDLTDGTGGPEDYERYTMTLVPLGDRTEMTLRQSGGHLTDEEYLEAEAGTNAFLDSMASLFGTVILKGRHETI